ncbi:prion-inhibition and propagation, helo domain-containing protein, partial [Apiosordaria backusii]
AVGLVTLFGTCVEGYNKIQLMRTSDHDYDFLVTKFELVKTRFELWGQTIGLQTKRYSSDESVTMVSDKTLCANWDGVSATVGSSLISIREIFDDRDSLEEKYGLKLVSNSAATGNGVRRSSTFPFLSRSRS